MPRVVPRPPVSPVREVVTVDTAVDQLEVPREARPVDQEMVDMEVEDQPSLAREVMEDTAVDLDQPREGRLVDQVTVDTAVDLDQPREVRPAVQAMVDTVDTRVIPREVRDQVRVMVDTDREVILSLLREAEEDTEVDLDQERYVIVIRDESVVSCSRCSSHDTSYAHTSFPLSSLVDSVWQVWLTRRLWISFRRF